jgi:hypothetical protein
MESIYFALGAVSAAIIIYWAWSAEQGKQGPYGGLLAMRRPGAAEKPRKHGRRTYRGGE